MANQQQITNGPSERRLDHAIRASLGTILIAFLATSPGLAEDSSLTLGDLEAYRQALENQRDLSPKLVGFRDLWSHPAEYLGRPVRVEGRIKRQFQQAAVGEFPPLVEAWILSSVDDPICLVFPIKQDRPPPADGTWVRFDGTYLKRLRYQGGDVARVAPLLVGPEAPTIVESGASVEFGRSWSSTHWIMGLGVAAMVALVLARRHFSRPISQPISIEPPPVFVDVEPDLIEDLSGEVGATDDQSHE
ncbi:hypothetical protein P12x_001496 [Tundrisphaera lichenicola]|uniref:hypothetical protein n=1 Tax=Tundrisphaera lichenicola TaxID=2029860 RepID=UPI003EBD4F5C